ncbi:MAG TPA: cyclic peptide export ABC transporter [Thermodesulfobacteriota bacterium]
MTFLAFLLRASWRTVVLAVAAALVSGAGSAGLVALSNAALARYGRAPTAFLAAFVALALVVLVARTASRVILVHLTQRSIFDLQVGIARRILAAPYRRLEEAGSARLLAALTDDVQAIGEALPAVPIFATNVATVAGVLIYLGWLAWPVLLAVLGVVAVGALGFRFVAEAAMRAFERAREERDGLFAHFRALTEGLKELKLGAARRAAFMADVLEPAAEAYRRRVTRGRTLYTSASGATQALYFTVLGLLVFALPVATDLPQETATGFVLGFFFILSPLDEIMDWSPLISRADVAVRKLDALGLSLAEAAEPDPVPTTRPRAVRIDLVGVTHRYAREGEERTFTLGPVDLAVRSGELLFLVGGNGSGKTTLAKLLTGLYAPETGEVRLDGEPVTEETRPAYRELFAAVFSDGFLFDRLLGLASPDLDARARDYLRRLELDHKVTIEGGVLSTTALSQGQRKRLALLAAYLEDRPAYLFDEWASDQDPVFKAVFYRQILPDLKRRGKAVVVISHDDRYYDAADRVVKLESGRIVAETRPSVAGRSRLDG